MTTCVEPRPVTVAVPDDTRYEYRIPRKLPHIVQVRPVRRKGQLRGDWYTYMSCASHADALRILSMLAEGESERKVVVTS